MSTRSWIAVLLFMPFNAVIFGALLIAVLILPIEPQHLPMAVIAAVVVSGPVSALLSWMMAPRLRARFWRKRESEVRAAWR